MTRTRARNTFFAQMERVKEKRSLLPLGKTIRAAIWQRLAPMHPEDVDRLLLWEVGALLNSHMVDRDVSEVANVERIMADRASRIEDFTAKRRDRQKAKKARKKR